MTDGQRGRRERDGRESDAGLVDSIASTLSTRPFARRPYGWPFGYSISISVSTARTAGLSSSWRIERDDLAAPRRDLGLRKRRPHRDVAERASSIASKSSDRHVQTDASARGGSRRVEATRRGRRAPPQSRRPVRVVVPRSITRDTKCASPGRSGGIAGAARPRTAAWIVTAGVVRACFRDDDDPVGQDTPRGSRVRASRRRCHDVRHEPADRPSCSPSAIVQRPPRDIVCSVTAAMRRQRRRRHDEPPIVSKYPSWCAILVTLSFSNTRRARSWFFAFCSSLGGDAVSRNVVECATAADLESAERRAVRRRDRDRVQKRLLGRQQRAAHGRCQPRVDQRAVQPRAALRRRRPEARPEVHRPSRRSARRRAPASGRNPAS